MDLKDYAWNDHERQLKAGGLEKIPSPNKVKIVDASDKRTELEEALTTLTQAELAKWALLNAESFISDIDINDSEKQTDIIQASKAKLLIRINSQASAYEIRQAGFLANTLAKEAVSDISKFAGRVFAQAIATGHMRGHAIVSADYAIKVINLKYPKDMDKVIEEREHQLQLVKEIR